MGIEYLALALTLVGAIVAYIHSVSKHASELMSVNLTIFERLSQLERDLLSTRTSLDNTENELRHTKHQLTELQERYKTVIDKAKLVINSLQRQNRALRAQNKSLVEALSRNAEHNKNENLTP